MRDDLESHQRALGPPFARVICKPALFADEEGGFEFVGVYSNLYVNPDRYRWRCLRSGMCFLDARGKCCQSR